MTKHISKAVLFFILVISLISQTLIHTGCANMMPPQGGYRDSIPPLLVGASPHDSSNHFSEKRITLTFDEFIQLQNTNQELIMSPLPEVDPVIESKLRTVIIRLKDSLKANTTYTLNFGNAIRDVNEGNIAKNFTYIFSTGETFDSLTLAGKVILAQNGKTDSTLIVMLHKHGDDSAVVNEKPLYLTHLDSSGNFRFRNLPSGTFYIYALQDQGGGHRYNSEKQLFGFADSAINIETTNKPIVLYAYIGETAATSSSKPTLGPKPKPAAGAEKQLKVQTNLSDNQLGLLDTLALSFELPLKKLDTSLIHVSSDSTFVPISDYHIFTDTSQKKLTLQYNWKENTRYNLILEKDFAEDTSGRALLKTDTLIFKTKKLSDYGNIKMRFKNLDLSVNPVLLFVQNDNVVKSFPLTATELNLAIFPPGDYDLRILYDRNKNGRWDPGEFFGKRVQPEIVKPIGRKVTIKPNWSNEFEIAL